MEGLRTDIYLQMAETDATQNEQTLILNYILKQCILLIVQCSSCCPLLKHDAGTGINETLHGSLLH